MALLLALVADAAAAQQPCGVRNRYRIANSYSGAGSELNVDTGWQPQGPLITPGSNANPGPTCSSQGSCTPTSDFGSLRVEGTGSATNCASSGVFLLLDQSPQAQFLDTMTVTSTTLPNGTPVQVQFDLSLAGFATVVDGNPLASFRADFNASSLSLVFLDATGATSGLLNTSVGATITVSGNLSVTLYARSLLGLGIPPVHGSYAVDLSARFGITCLTPGVSLGFCSGRSYPTQTAEAVSVGGGCGPGSPSLVATLPRLGQTQTFTLSNAPPAAAVFLAFAPGPAVSSALGACTVRVDQTLLQTVLTGVTDPAGGSQFALAIPAAPTFAGLRFTVQDIVLAPGGPLLGLGVLSNGVQSTIGL